MTIYKLNDYDDWVSDLGIFQSKLTEKQIKKIVKITTVIYSVDETDDYKTSIFEALIKKGYYEAGVTVRNNRYGELLKTLSQSEKKLFNECLKSEGSSYDGQSEEIFYLLKSPYIDKNFKWIKVKEIEF